MNKEWEEECMKYWGRVLLGDYTHYCYDWDGLPIDETCKEFDVCTCYQNIPSDNKILSHE